MRARPAVSFIAWSSVEGRSREIAAFLDGEARCFYSFGLPGRAFAPLRYVVDGTRTLAYLASRRPRAVIVTNPPVFPGLIAMGYGKAVGAPVILDSHPAAFGQKESLSGRLLLPLHRRMVSRVAGNIVPSDDLAEVVRSWGGRAEVFHEAPPDWSVAVARPTRANGRARVLLVGILAPDEPVGEATAAVRSLPEVDLVVTGDARKLAATVIDQAPDNVRFAGFLRGDDFRREIEQADIILTLSTNQTAAMRAAYEAVYARRPLVVSDSPGRRELFPYAIHVENDAKGIEAGLRRAVEEHSALIDATEDALLAQRERLQRQVESLNEVMTSPSPRLAETFPRS